MGYVYLVQPDNLIGTNRYKIGMSNCTNDSRLKSYGKKTIIHGYFECENAIHKERELLVIFRKNFKNISGNEYFEGDINDMIIKFNVITAGLPIINEVIPLYIKIKNEASINNNEIPLENVYINGKKNYQCSKCDKIFNKKSNYNQHINRKKPCISNNKTIIDTKLYCPDCNKKFSRRDNLNTHKKNNCKVNNKDFIIKKLELDLIEKITENELIIKELALIKKN